MTDVCLLKRNPKAVAEIQNYLREPSKAAIEVLEVGGARVSMPDLFNLHEKVLNEIRTSGAASEEEKKVAGDELLAREIHIGLSEVRRLAPWILNDGKFWSWLALFEFRDYALIRWCDGDEWLKDSSIPQPKDSKLDRFIMRPESVHSQSRHVIRRLYIYAECSFGFDGTYKHIPLMLQDLDVPGSVFERRLGLSPTLALMLIRSALKLTASPKTSSKKAVSARQKRRKFMREVNLLLSTVALETLDEREINSYLDQILVNI